MIQALIGKKIDQTQMFLQNGRRIPVTEVALQDNVVVQVKTEDNDKYTAVQLGYGLKKKSTKAVSGHAKKAKLETAPALLKEVAWDGEGELPAVGDVVAVDTVFKPGDIIAVTGTSKGKGFAGVMKRHNFRGGPKSHGQSDRERAPGSIGQTTTPGRVYRGKRMAGHMGVDTVTVQNLSVVDVDATGKKLYVLGLVPGHKNAMLLITRTGELKNFVPLLKPVVEEPEAPAAEEASVEEPTTVVEAAAELAEKQEAAEAQEEKTEEVKEEATEETAAKVAGEDVAEKKEETKEEKK